MNICLAILLGLLVAAIRTDLHTRRIDNRMALAGTAVALAYHGLAIPGEGILSSPGGGLGLLTATGGVAVGFTALIPLYALRVMGAGDVKLMMMVGAFLGPFQTLGVVLLTFISGGMLAIVAALWMGSFLQLMENVRFLITTCIVHATTGANPQLERIERTAGRMPYAIAIAAGTLLQLLLVRNGGWALS